MGKVLVFVLMKVILQLDLIPRLKKEFERVEVRFSPYLPLGFRRSPNGLSFLVFLYCGRSMQGTFQQGQLLLALPSSFETIRPGDVVVFRSIEADGRGIVVAHRVHSKASMGLITKGDNNTCVDTEIVREEDLIGRVVFIQRGKDILPVWGGEIGRFWQNFLPLLRYLFQLSRGGYSVLRESRVVSHIWQPSLSRLCVYVDGVSLVKYVHKGRTVALWMPEKEWFWCSKPYDLVIDYLRNSG